MKVLLIFVAFGALATCEVLPPVYRQPQILRPNPQIDFNGNAAYQRPQQTLDVKIPPKFTIEQLIRLTEQLRGGGKIVNGPQNGQTIQVNLEPGSSYLPQNYKPPNQLRPPVPTQTANPWQQPPVSSQPTNSWQKPPVSSQPTNAWQQPPTSNQPINSWQQPPQYKPPPPQTFVPNQPDKVQWTPQTTPQPFRPPLRPSQPFQNQYVPPQNFGGSNRPPVQVRPPSTSYGVPDYSGVENFGDESNKQNLPYNKPAGGFRPDQEYLPPQTTPRVPIRPITSTTPGTPEVATVNPNFEPFDGQVTQKPSTNGGDEGADGDPNIAISNAVAGAGSFFYLQQPDGRLQRVILQKIKDPNGKPEEYVANYYFQNIQALPNVVYTPLISLGEYQQNEI